MTKEGARKEAQAIFDARIVLHDAKNMLEARDEKAFTYYMTEGLDLDPDADHELRLLCDKKRDEWTKAYYRAIENADSRRLYRAYTLYWKMWGTEQEWTEYLGESLNLAHGAAPGAEKHLTAREKKNVYAVVLEYIDLTAEEEERLPAAGHYRDTDAWNESDIWDEVAGNCMRGTYTIPHDVWTKEVG